MRTARLATATFLGIVFAHVGPASARAERVTGPLRIYVLNVGQGDAILVVCPRHTHQLLVDAGARREAGSVKAFQSILASLVGGESPIETVVATHPHDDHVAGLPWVLDTFEIGTFVDSGRPYTPAYARIETSARSLARKGRLTYVRASDHPPPHIVDFCSASNVAARLLVPRTFGDDANPNNHSVVVLVTYNQQRFLFTGDAEEKEEQQLLNDPVTARYVRDATVYKVGHHGSHTSSTASFLGAVRPKMAVISSGCRGGTNKQYRHPRAATLDALRRFVVPSGATEGNILAGLEDRGDGTSGDGWSTRRIPDGVHITAKGGSILIESDGTHPPTVSRPSLAGERAPCPR
jgi:competence protein ComEC